jgi:hypothetical protein
MNNLRTFFWVSFTVAVFFLLLIDVYVGLNSDGFDMMKLQFASSSEGAEILKQWYSTDVDGTSQLYFAGIHTWIDFLFIIGYVGVLCMISYSIMQRVKKIRINEFLRWCFPAAILIGLFDVIENVLVLFSMFHYQPANHYFATYWFSYPKWGLLVIILVVWLTALIGGLFNKKQLSPQPSNHD